MSRIGFVFTNYNNSFYTGKLIESLSDLPISLGDVVIVDNNSRSDQLNVLKEIQERFPELNIIYNDVNLGYFRGLNVGISYLNSSNENFDFMVIGNNDLEFPIDFVSAFLNACPRWKDKMVIAPDIITLDGEHQNPHVKDGISVLREFVWDLYFMNYKVARFITLIASYFKGFFSRKDHLDFRCEGYIYQGYGACYILTNRFFDVNDELYAPTFLMGEELFLTYQLSKSNDAVYYDPSVTVKHVDHASTGTLPLREFWEISRESHRVYRRHVSRFNSRIHSRYR